MTKISIFDFWQKFRFLTKFRPIFTTQKRAPKCPEDINIESTITLHTNASTFTYPLLYYSGMIKYSMVWLEKEFYENSENDLENENSKILDFGLTSVDEQKCLIMALHNHNNRVVKETVFYACKIQHFFKDFYFLKKKKSKFSKKGFL